jgi:hypothetical protein
MKVFLQFVKLPSFRAFAEPEINTTLQNPWHRMKSSKPQIMSQLFSSFPLHTQLQFQVLPLFLAAAKRMCIAVRYHSRQSKKLLDQCCGPCVHLQYIKDSA